MSTNVEQSNLGLENLFKRAKKFYSQSRSNYGEYTHSKINGVLKEAQKIVAQRQNASVEMKSPILGKSLDKNDRKVSNELNEIRDSIKGNNTKDLNEILVPEDAHLEIRSGNSSLQGVRNSGNCEPEICRNYASSKTLNPEKLTEIINNSIKAAVKNLANDGNPVCWIKEREQENETPMESSCFNDTCTRRLKSSQNKENVTSCTQYSQQEFSCVRPNGSGNICSVYANNGSKKSYNSHLRRSPPYCVPSSKSGTGSVICHQSVSKCKQITCPCVKKQPEKSSKSFKPCKSWKPSSKACRHLKADNRRMTGNVNIYICSEGNEGGSKKKKDSESTCNSMTVTNASCACSSADICACKSISSSKTIRDLMEKRKNAEDVTVKCVCGKPASDCECLTDQSKNDDDDALCLCDMSSINPTTSNETCRDDVEYNSQTPNSSGSSPQGDFCTRGIRSRSSSRQEPCCTRQNLGTFKGVNNPEDGSGIYGEKSKFKTGNSGRGDALQECSCCETFSNYSERKFNVCDCFDAINPPLRNQREICVPKNNVDYSRREDDACNCCAYENESLYSGGRKTDIDRFVCCKNKIMSKSRVRPQNKDFCTKPCNAQRSFLCDGNNRQRPGYSNFCIMEEDETYDTSTCPSPCAKQQKCNTIDTFREDSRRFCRENSDARKEGADAIELQEPINDGKKNDAEIVKCDVVSASQTVANSKRISVAEVVKSYSNADKSTSSNMISPSNAVNPSLPVSEKKSVVQPKRSLEKESKRSSLKWPFSSAKSSISSKNKLAESKKKKSQADTPTPKTNASAPMETVKSGSIRKNSENVKGKTMNAGGNSSSVAKSTAGESPSPIVKGSSGGNSLIAIKTSASEEIKSEELVGQNNKTKPSSSRLGSLIADRKNSVQSARNETALSQAGNESNGSCYCGAEDADICTCQNPQCPCCNRPQEDCSCNITQDRSKEQTCKSCKRAKRLCSCSDQNGNQKKCRTVREDGGFRVCTLCCRPEVDCCCNSGGKTTRPSRSSSNSYNKSEDCHETVRTKSQICIYCEEPRDKCACRGPIRKCSYCGMPIDVCNCQNVTNSCNACNYDENICQCNGRVIQNSDNGDQSICVTAWTPRRDVRKYFSRNPGERDNPDCSCCDTVRPYGSDELPYQRLSVFSDVMTELQQKMSELACCNRCGKTPCCCAKSYPSPTNETRICNTKQKKSRTKSPPCRHCLGNSPCKCGGRKSSLYQICNRCRTAPCRCRKSRSTQRKPQAKCYYCKCSPCRCESSKANGTTSKSCRCNGSPSRSQAQTSSIPERSLDRNPPTSRGRSCRCRCGSSGCGSPSRGQERPCG